MSYLRSAWFTPGTAREHAAMGFAKSRMHSRLPWPTGLHHLEQPVRGLYADLMAPLLNAVQSARKRGAAVLWTVTDPETWNHPGIFATTQARMFGSQIHVIEKES